MPAVIGQCCHRVGRGLNEPCPSTLLTCPVAEMRLRPEPVHSLMTLRRADGGAVEVDIEAAPFTTGGGKVLTLAPSVGGDKAAPAAASATRWR